MLNPEDRYAIEDLFAKLEDVQRRSGPRDRDAETLIGQRMGDQPAAPYYMAQTIIVQERALQEAQKRITELEARANRTGRSAQAERGPWGGREDSGERFEERRGRGPGGGLGGGGFLAGAAQTAMGVAGGVLLGNMIAGMFGGGEAQAAEAPADDVQDHNFDEPDAGQDDFGSDDFDMGGGF